MGKRHFLSNLAPKIESFLDFKHSMGILYKTSRIHLLNFDLYNFNNGNYDYLKKEIVENWIAECDKRSLSQDRSYIPPIRELGRYLVRMGDKESYILDERFKMSRYHADVYLMSEAEINAFFRECNLLASKDRIKSRGIVIPAIFRFMYCCGVRTCEARLLKCSEVNLNEGYLDLLFTKKYKDRRIFLSNELKDYLSDYDMKISKIFHNREYIFVNTQGRCCSSNTTSEMFRKIWCSAGLKYDGKVKPRAYDFRHHFACANLMKWADEGKNINSMLPYLMRYMGHIDLNSTYYYTHLLPDFYPQYKDLASSTEEIIPEVDNEV